MATYKNQKTYNISPTSGDTDRDGVNASFDVAKTPRQEFMTQQLKKIKTKTNVGDHIGAQADYEKYFKGK
tara:strand:+ start:228 stop:437 length:210 start_codon:yes stop_codon:yes gene_type:complete